MAGYLERICLESEYYRVRCALFLNFHIICLTEAVTVSQNGDFECRILLLQSE